ncbi:MAG: transcription antitermination factor NusB [Bacteroidota bacterium]
MLRIKIMQALYAWFKAEPDSIEKSEKELFFSINKTYDLFHYLLLVLIDVCDFAESRIDLALNKQIPTFDDLNPNEKFVRNEMISQIRDSKKLNQYLKVKKMSWVNHPELIRKLFQQFQESDSYKKYMGNSSTDFIEDKKLVLSFYEEVLPNNEQLYQILEEQSIFWNDDTEFVISMIMRTVKATECGKDIDIPALFKNEDDIEFVRTVFRKTIFHHDEHMQLIEKYTKNWDIDRIAFLDLLIIEMAVTEIRELVAVPVKVSFDEYLEIAKYYSTERSSGFVNGILDKIIHELRENKQIIKRGRGLIGEN